MTASKLKEKIHEQVFEWVTDPARYLNDELSCEQDLNKLLINFAEAYHKHRLESVSDEEMKKGSIASFSIADDLIEDRNNYVYGFKKGVGWLRNYLLTDK